MSTQNNINDEYITTESGIGRLNDMSYVLYGVCCSELIATRSIDSTWFQKYKIKRI